MDKIIILGCGGHAKSIVDIIEQQGKYDIAGFISNEDSGSFAYRGYQILGGDALLPQIFLSGVHYAVIAVGYLGNSRVRDRLYEKLKSIGYLLPAIVDPSAILAKDIRIGEGSVVGKGAVINSNAVIGAMTIINTRATIEHDCIIEDYAHVAVGCALCGNVIVKNHTFIGAGTNIIPGITVGENVIIGAGSTVISSVQPNSCVYGIVK